MRILLISYHFFNYSSEGMVTAKLARGLVDRGHSLRVITSCHNWLDRDPARIGQDLVADIPVERVAEDESLLPGWWRAAVRHKGRPPFWSRVLAAGTLVHGCPPEDFAWVAPATRAALATRQGADDDAPEVMLTRLNPVSSHLVGLAVKRRWPGLPWCAYFSDPWPHHLYPAPYTSQLGRWSRWRFEQLLDRILGRSGSLVFPCDRLRDHILNGPRARFRAKSVVAPHLSTFGTQPATAGAAEPAHLVLRHAGLLMKERRIEPLLDAVRLVLRSRPAAAAQLRIEFTGRYHNCQGGKVPETPADLREVVEYQYYTFPDKVEQWLNAAEVFLLVEAKLEQGVFMPSKLADYLAAGKPILALSPRVGTVADYLENGGGLVVEPDDVPGIAAALERLLDLWQAGRLAELRPPATTVARVSPEQVVPLYEQALRRASGTLA